MNPKLMQDLISINRLDPNQSSLAIDQSNQLIQIHKRSVASNFWHWIIHIITFTLVPRNKSLDEVTKRILQETQDLPAKQTLTVDEKNLLCQAISKLQKIIKCNGGGQEKTVSELLGTIHRIQALHAVKNLTNTTTSSTHPPIPVSDDQRLKTLLQSKCDLYDRSAESLKEISTLLLDMHGSVELSPAQTNYLSWTLSQISPQWIDTHAKKLSPGIIRFLAEKCLNHDSEKFIELLFQQLLTEPVDKERLTAFVHSLPVSSDKPINPREQGPLLGSDNFKKLSTQNIRTLENHLSPQDLQHFIHSFFTFNVLYNDSFKTDDETLLKMVKEFKPEHQVRIRQILCKGENPEFLAKLLISSDPVEQLCNQLFLNHKNMNAKFYKELIQHAFRHNNQPLFYDHLITLSANIFKYSSQDVQTLLGEKLENDLQATLELIPFIPSTILMDFSEYTLRKLFEELKKNDSRQNELQKIANVIEKKLGNKLFDSHHNYDAILPFLSPVMQTKMLEIRLSQLINGKSTFQDQKLFFSEAGKLDSQIWQDVIQKIQVENSIITKLDPQRCFKALEENGIPLEYIVLLINNQLQSPSLIQGFFIHFFSSLRWDLTPIFQHLNINIFQHFNFMDLHVDIWKHFLKAIHVSNDDETKYFLAAFDKLLSHSKVSQRFETYFYALENPQFEVLASKMYPPALQLNILCQAHQLNDPKAQGLVQKLQEANKGEVQSFLDLFLSPHNSKKSSLAHLMEWMKEHSLFEEKDLNHANSLMGACLRLFFDNSPLPTHEKLKILKHFSPQMLTFMTHPNVSKYLSIEVIYALIGQLHGIECRQLIYAQWGRIIQHLDRQNDEFFVRLIAHLEDPVRLRAVFDLAFFPRQGQVTTLKKHKIPLLKELLKNPWKLLLVIQEGQRNASIKATLTHWLNENSQEGVQRCQKVIDNYHLSPREELVFFENIEKLNFYCRSDEYKQAENIYRNLDEHMQRLFTQSFHEKEEHIELKEKEVVIEKMSEAQLFAILINNECRKELINYLKKSQQNANKDSLNRTLALAHRLAKNPEYQHLQEDFIDKLEKIGEA
ncbi:MAG: hypothetical protein BGO14_11520 [Chlamydiales bacterium 38-26]|nr:hypothetical protein [Chlamydiales bacterium]OJV11570.1 MAG: hypothetical protein BGO14_11520 [Chlamydiales bacterium 38-26]